MLLTMFIDDWMYQERCVRLSPSQKPRFKDRVSPSIHPDTSPIDSTETDFVHRVSASIAPTRHISLVYFVDDQAADAVLHTRHGQGPDLKPRSLGSKCSSGTRGRKYLPTKQWVLVFHLREGRPWCVSERTLAAEIWRNMFLSNTGPPQVS